MQKSIRKYWPLFVLPTMAAFAIGFIIPFCYGVFLSFCKFTTVTDWKWVGVQNYTKIFYVAGKLDTTFLHSLWYTTLFTVVTMAIINIAAFAIAMALTKGIRGTNFFRTCFFLADDLQQRAGKALDDDRLHPVVRLLGARRCRLLAADRIHDDHLRGRHPERLCRPH